MLNHHFPLCSKFLHNHSLHISAFRFQDYDNPHASLCIGFEGCCFGEREQYLFFFSLPKHRSQQFHRVVMPSKDGFSQGRNVSNNLQVTGLAENATEMLMRST